jgi:CheY-like chemotaxis protein
MEFIVIDDDRTVQMLSKAVIFRSASDADIVPFLSPVDGLEYINTQLVQSPNKSVILLDINMPVMNGWELLQNISPKVLEKDHHIFMYSSSIDQQDKKRAEEHTGVRGFIEKPLTLDKVQLLLQQISTYVC